MCGFIGVLKFNNNDIHIPYSQLEEAIFNPEKKLLAQEYIDTNSMLRFYSGTYTEKYEQRNRELLAPGISYCLFNGDIYNWEDINQSRAEAADKIIANEYVRLGSSLFCRLDGGFSCCIKTAVHRLVLAVDRIGQETVYWSETRDALWFSSSALLLAFYLNKEPKGLEGLLQHLILRGQCIGESYFEGINSIPPKHMLLWDNNRAKLCEWEDTGYFSTLGHNAREYNNVIKKRIPAAKFGVLLSGGLDSSIIASVASESSELDKVHCFSLVSSDNEYLNKDLEYSSILAKNNKKILHHKVPFSCGPADTAPKDMPVTDHDEFGLNALALAMSQCGLQTVLNGDGPDELFCGYDRIFKYSAGMENLPEDDFLKAFLYRYSYIDLDFLKGNLDSDIFGNVYSNIVSYYKNITSFGKASKLKSVHRWFITHHLFWPSRNSDSHGLKTVSPFLAPRIVISACNLDEEMLVPYKNLDSRDADYNLYIKKYLKDIYKDILPEAIIRRDKLPFPICSSQILELYFAALDSYSPEMLLPGEMHCKIINGEAGTNTQLLYMSYLIWRESCKNHLT